MSNHKYSPRTTAQWEESFAAYNDSSGLTQQAFCELHGLSHSGFRHRYRSSPLFMGKRRRSSAAMAAGVAGASAPSASSGFRPVRASASRPTASAEPRYSDTGSSIVVRLSSGIGIECAGGADPAVVAALVRELVR